MEWKNLSKLKRGEIEKLQNKLLRRFIAQQIPYHPYYSRLFKKLNIKFTDVKTTNDLTRVPFTTKLNLVSTPKEPNYRDFILQPNKELLKTYAPKTTLLKFLFNKKLAEYEYKPIHMHFTTGRSSAPIPFFYTAYDLERLGEAGARMMDVFGITNDEIAVNAFPYFPHLAFWQTFFAMKKIGVLGLHTGGGKVLSTERIINAVEGMRANIIAVMPGYGYHMLKIAKKKRKNFSSIKHVIFGGECVSPGLREKIKKLLISMGAKNPKVLSTYALTEGKAAWPECCDKSGYHTYPDMEFIELVDKDGERVAEGEKGEIVYTAIGWRGSVVLRYKTGDITKRMYFDKCPYCGRTVPRIDAGIERKSEYEEMKLTKVKGSLVNLNIFSPLLMGHKDVEEWQLEIKKRNNDPYELDEMYLYVAPKQGASFEKLKKDLENKIRAETEVTPNIVKMDAKKIEERLGMETELKEKRIVDNRKIR